MPVLKLTFKFIKTFWRSGIFLCISIYLFTANFSGVKGPGIMHVDKLVHLSVFVTFSFIMMYDINRNRYDRPFRGWWFVMLVLLLYGGSIEMIQTWFLPYRTGNWYDMLFDALGTFAGIYFYFLYKNSRLVKPAANQIS